MSSFVPVLTTLFLHGTVDICVELRFNSCFVVMLFSQLGHILYSDRSNLSWGWGGVCVCRGQIVKQSVCLSRINIGLVKLIVKRSS